MAKRESRHLSLLMCEIGNITQPHETNEGEARSRCLNAIAAAIECISSRPTDFVCRYGDNSFAVILPNTYEEGALHVAKRIHESVESVLAKTSIGWPATPLSFRIGLATYDGQSQTMDDLIHAANATLRNCLEKH